MKQQKEVRISYLAAHLTTIVSVSLVLLLMGIIALVWISADKETRRLKERIELSVIMADSIPDARTRQLASEIEKEPYAANVTVIGKQQAMENWKAETGEDLEAVFGVNPLSPEINFSVRADYASSSQIKNIVSSLSALPGVEGVSAPDATMVESMNRNIAALTVVLAIVAAIMLVISFVLINNTVHLTIYSRRFTIHTMQLVGATNAYIRRPVVVNNMLAGLVAGLVASGILALVMVGAEEGGLAGIMSYVGWTLFACVAAGLVVAGMILCALAAWVAADRYLRKDYDGLFR